MAQRTSHLLVEAMLKEAAETITRNSTAISAEVGTHHGWPCLILDLVDAPHSQIIAHVRTTDG